MLQPVPIAIVAAMLLSACSGPQRTNEADRAVGEMGAPEREQNRPRAGQTQWDLQSSGEGVALALLTGNDRVVVRLFCPAGRHRLLINVPAFRPIESEERMSFGSDREAMAMVADSRGDRLRGGVTAEASLPDNLAALVGGEVSINYGAQNSGPHPAPPEQLVRGFAAACREAPPAEPGPPEGDKAGAGSAGACRMQEGKALAAISLNAVGTEPFWAAHVDGRCVTYSTPEDQRGTRIWTQFSGSREAGVWTGFHRDRRFVLRTRPLPGCSDGMSDRRYPIAVTVEVAGETRTGCAS